MELVITEIGSQFRRHCIYHDGYQNGDHRHNQQIFREEILPISVIAGCVTDVSVGGIDDQTRFVWTKNDSAIIEIIKIPIVIVPVVEILIDDIL